MRVLYQHFLSWLYIMELWGPRCSAYEPECGVCVQWRFHDEIFNGVDSDDFPAGNGETEV